MSYQVEYVTIKCEDLPLCSASFLSFFFPKETLMILENLLMPTYFYKPISRHRCCPGLSVSRLDKISSQLAFSFLRETILPNSLSKPLWLRLPTFLKKKVRRPCILLLNTECNQVTVFHVTTDKVSCCYSTKTPLNMFSKPSIKNFS